MSFVTMSNKMDISSFNVAQSGWCGNEGKKFRFSAKISSILLTFVDYTCRVEASFLLRKKMAESVSSHPAGQPINSSTSLLSLGHLHII